MRSLERAQEQRRLPDARLTADEDEGAGDEPPPSTRSSSGTPVGMRSPSFAETSPRGIGVAARAEPAPLLEASSSSASVPNAPQPGHLPSQRGLAVPHSVHTCWTRTFRGHAASLGTRSDAVPRKSRPIRLQDGRASIRVLRNHADDDRKEGPNGQIQRSRPRAQIMAVAGVLLFIDLFLRWQEVEFDLGPLERRAA